MTLNSETISRHLINALDVNEPVGKKLRRLAIGYCVFIVVTPAHFFATMIADRYISGDIVTILSAISASVIGLAMLTYAVVLALGIWRAASGMNGVLATAGLRLVVLGHTGLILTANYGLMIWAVVPSI